MFPSINGLKLFKTGFQILWTSICFNFHFSLLSWIRYCSLTVYLFCLYGACFNCWLCSKIEASYCNILNTKSKKRAEQNSRLVRGRGRGKGPINIFSISITNNLYWQENSKIKLYGRVKPFASGANDTANQIRLRNYSIMDESCVQPLDPLKGMSIKDCANCPATPLQKVHKIWGQNIFFCASDTICTSTTIVSFENRTYLRKFKALFTMALACESGAHGAFVWRIKIEDRTSCDPVSLKQE
jgi:hypothetical protein